MSGLILPSTYKERSVIERGGDVADITRSVQEGDPTLGWRGDPSMDVYREGSEVKVYGFDVKGTRYIAATVNIVDSDWRATLLKKLRNGDWQRDDFLNQFNADKAENEKRQQQELDDKISEVADKYVSATYRDRGSKRYY